MCTFYFAFRIFRFEFLFGDFFRFKIKNKKSSFQLKTLRCPISLRSISIRKQKWHFYRSAIADSLNVSFSFQSLVFHTTKWWKCHLIDLEFTRDELERVAKQKFKSENTESKIESAQLSLPPTYFISIEVQQQRRLLHQPAAINGCCAVCNETMNWGEEN